MFIGIIQAQKTSEFFIKKYLFSIIIIKMSYFSTFYGYNQPYYDFNVIQFETNPIFETYDQNSNRLNGYVNSQLYQNFDIETSESKCTNSRFSSLKNSAQSYINAIYKHVYPNFVNYSSRIFKRQSDRESESELSDNGSIVLEGPRRHHSVENFINHTKNKILGRHRRSISTDTTMYQNENFDTTPYSIKLQHRYRTYSSDDQLIRKKSNIELSIRNILLPEVVIRNVRYNRPEIVLKNLENFINSNPETNNTDN